MLGSKSLGKQTGISLVEMMIGMAIGLVIVGAATSVYVNSVRSGSDALRSAKLNIELGGAMNMMVSEIRRAGYAFDLDTATVAPNPFTQATTNISIPSTDCVVFSYDANGNGVVDSPDFVGFRLQEATIDMRQGGTTSNAAGCGTGSGAWEGITDPNTVIVDTLTFAVTHQCVNAQTGTNSATQACVAGNAIYDAAVAGASKSDLVEVRDVAISLTGHHKDDSATTITLNQSVRVRNDRIQTVGP